MVFFSVIYSYRQHYVLCDHRRGRKYMFDVVSVKLFSMVHGLSATKEGIYYQETNDMMNQLNGDTTIMHLKKVQLEDIEKGIINLEKIEDLVKNALDAGTDPIEIMNAIRKGLEEVGRKYENGEYFLMELILAGNAAKELMDIIMSSYPHNPNVRNGKVVIGTVGGDIHDIGKNLVATVLLSAGFEVRDLGTDVACDKFVEAVRDEKPEILALSGLLTVCMNQFRSVIEKLEQAGLRKNVKIVVGGRPISQDFANEIGADAYGKDAMDAIAICGALLKETRVLCA